MREVVEMKLRDLIPYENNPRSNIQAIDMVKKSIQEFGFTNPIIVDKNMVIIAGHTRYCASKELGLALVPVIVISDLTEEKVQAYRIMDNKSGEFAEWDYTKLMGEISELELSDFDLTLTGFDKIDIEKLKIELELGDDIEIPDIDLGNEIVKEDKKPTASAKIKFGEISFKITDEELELLTERYKEYIEENDNISGFIYEILG